jgi:hypothetical protein
VAQQGHVDVQEFAGHENNLARDLAGFTYVIGLIYD